MSHIENKNTKMKPGRSNSRSQRGFSLIELMIVTAVLIVGLGAVTKLLTSSQSISVNERQTLDMLQDARGAFDTMVSEIRMAGAGLPGNVYNLTGYGVTSATASGVTVIGNFTNTSTTASAINAGSGAVTVASTTGFVAGQTVALTNADASYAVYTTISSITGSVLTVSTTTTSILSGSTLGLITAGASVDVISSISYSISSGTISRQSGPYLTPASAVTSTLADGVKDAAGNDGLSFTYYDRAGNQLTGTVNTTQVTLIQMNLTVRTDQVDVTTGNYRTLTLTASIRPRNQ